MFLFLYHCYATTSAFLYLEVLESNQADAMFSEALLDLSESKPKSLLGQ